MAVSSHIASDNAFGSILSIDFGIRGGSLNNASCSDNGVNRNISWGSGGCVTGTDNVCRDVIFGASFDSHGGGDNGANSYIFFIVDGGDVPSIDRVTCCGGFDTKVGTTVLLLVAVLRLVGVTEVSITVVGVCVVGFGDGGCCSVRDGDTDVCAASFGNAGVVGVDSGADRGGDTCIMVWRGVSNE